MAISKLNINVRPGERARSSDFNSTTGKVDEIIDAINSGEVGGKVDVDAELSDESKNPVENAVITARLREMSAAMVTSKPVGSVETSQPIEGIDYLRYSMLHKVLFPQDADGVEIVIGIGNLTFSLGKILPATPAMAGLMTPDMVSRLMAAESPVFPQLTQADYDAMLAAGTIENRFYTIYKDGSLSRLYLGETMLCERSPETQGSSIFPLSMPFIFS